MWPDNEQVSVADSAVSVADSACPAIYCFAIYGLSI